MNDQGLTARCGGGGVVRISLAQIIGTATLCASTVACTLTSVVPVHAVVRRPGCYEDTIITVAGTLSATSTSLPFSDSRVLRRLVDHGDSLAIELADTFPVGRLITVPVEIYLNTVVGLLVGGPVAVISTPSPSVHHQRSLP
jgi:hypothetical protein